MVTVCVHLVLFLDDVVFWFRYLIFHLVLSFIACQVEDSRRSGSPDSVPASGGAAQADHCHQEGHVGPT